MGLRHFKIGLQSLKSGASISETGGKCYVAVNAATNKATLYNADGTAKTNPLSLVNGEIEFWTLDTVPSVDLYIQAPSGHFLTAKNVAASGPTFYTIDKSVARTDMLIPFALVDTAAATETSTGFVLPLNCIVLPASAGLSVDVMTLEAGKTIDFGTGATVAESTGTENLFANALTLAAANPVISAVTATYVVTAAHTVSYTLSSGATVAAGFLKIPLLLPASAL